MHVNNRDGRRGLAVREVCGAGPPLDDRDVVLFVEDDSALDIVVLLAYLRCRRLCIGGRHDGGGVGG